MPSMSRMRENLSFYILGAFSFIALLNPVFKKYDYGAGYPLILLLAILMPIFVVLNWKKKSENEVWEKVFLGVFGLMLLLSFAFSMVQTVGFSEVLAYLTMIPLYFTFAYRKNEWAEKFVDLLVYLAFVGALMGLFNYIVEAEVRLFGPFFNILYHANVWPNAYGLFVLLSWPLFLRKWGPLRAVMLGVVLSSLVLTFSRGAVIAFLGQVLLLTLYNYRKLHCKNLQAMTICATVIILTYMSANNFRAAEYELLDVDARINCENQESLTSKQERVDFWEGAIELAGDYPIYGYGPSSFRYAYSPIQETFLGNADHPHNIFLKFAVENGLIAFLAFLGFLLMVLRRFVARFTKLKGEDRDFVYLTFVATAGALAHNMIDYNFNFAINLLLFFMLLALGRSKLIRKTTKKKDVAVLTVAVVLAIVAIYELVILGLAQLQNDDYLQYSLFPRDYYLNEVNESIEEGDFVEAEEFLFEQFERSSLDARTHYIEGVLCEKKGDLPETCLAPFAKAYALDSMNNFDYFTDYFRALEKVNPREAGDFANDIVPVIEQYFVYVDQNVHFTAYTPNVEAASRLITNILPYLPVEKQQELIYNMALMTARAEELRLEKTY